MAGFGSSIRLSRRDGWEGAYLNYDRLEAALTRLETLVLAVGTSTSGARGVGSRREGHEHQSLLFRPKAISLEHGFVDRLVKHSQAFLRDLHLEIERVALFSLKKQGELADAVGSLRFAEDPIFSSTSSSGIVGGGGGLLLLQLQEEYNGTASNRINNKVDQYSHVGVELLHLLRFIGINYTGVRKILEKFENVVYALMNMATDTNDIESTAVYLLKNSGNSSSSRNSSLSDDDHLRELANSAPIVAIQASLSQALEQCLADQDAMIANPFSLWRFEFVLDSIQTIRQSAADIVNSPFSNFLSRKAMIATGKNLNGLESSAFKAQEILLKFDPDSIRRMTFQELQDWHKRTTDMDQQQQQQHKPADRRQSRHRRLMSSKGPMSTRILVAIEDEIKQDQVDAKHYFRHWGGIDSISLAINFVSVLLYTIGYYVVAPNANHYAIALGYDGAFGATLIGASSFAALFGAFLYSFWYTKFSFKSALIFSSLCPLIGNLMYSLAGSFHHRGMPMAIGGRILCGFGSAEVVNRQIISTCVSFQKMTRASAFFVAAGAVGMSAGPLLGAVFDLTAGRDYEVDVKAPFMLPKGGIIYNHITGPCFFMAALWFAQLMALLVFFREPDRLNLMSSGRHTVFDASVTGSQTNTPTTTPLTLQQGDKKVLIGNGKEKNGTRWSSVLNEVSKTARLVFQNPGLPVTLLLFCYIEMADEVLISSCSMVTHRYFGWHGSTAGLIIASLGALVLPADFLVERAAHVSSERKIMKHTVVFLCLTLIGIMNYEAMFYDVILSSDEIFEDDHKDTDIKLGNKTIGELLLHKSNEFPYDWGAGRVIYVLFLSAFFMGTIILEGVDTSLMAKVTPAKLNSAFINSGFLATIIGTLGRVLADLLITTSALLDVYVFVDFVNATFLPLLLLALGGYFLVRLYYKEFLIS